MPRYRVIVRQDAWINHVAEVEAASPSEAAANARKAFVEDDSSILFENDGAVALDYVECDPDDCEEVEREPEEPPNEVWNNYVDAPDEILKRKYSGL
jgi:hypothetical protein